MATIQFFSEDINFVPKRKALLRQWLIDVAIKEDKTLGSLNYIFCNDSYLLQINKDYLNHHTLTDIITFPTEESFLSSRKTRQKERINGEIYISVERVEENSLKFDSGFEQELLRVMVHGLLHLCGFKDKSTQEAALMRKKEEFYIKRFPAHQ